MGPAGSGKSTYCDVIRQHCENTGRSVHIVNLDPAAEVFNYPVSLDIRDLITIDDVMEEMDFGPNGGLVYCLEYLVQNIDWLEEEIGDYGDDYIIIDCPGQIELYTHHGAMKDVIHELQRLGYSMCAVYLVDSNFMVEPSKFFSGVLMCLSAMYQLELPHLNVLTKMDLYHEQNKGSQYNDELAKYVDPDIPALVEELHEDTGDKFRSLNEALGSLIDTNPMVSFLTLDITDEDSVANLLANVDMALQYGEDVEPKELKEGEEEELDEFGDPFAASE
ncbi:GPN-loop GTPase 3 [Balamuthia mandrillaris]